MGVTRDAATTYRRAFWPVMASVVGYLVAGTILGEAGMRHVVETVPGLLVMLPGLMATRGNVYGAMGARIATGLHQGLIEPVFRVQDRLVTVTVAAVINGVVIAIVLAVSSRIILVVLGVPVAPFPLLLFVALVSTLLAAVAMTGVIIAVLFLGFRRGMDPDLLNGPIVTAVGDVAAVLFVYVAAILAGVIL